MDPCADAIGAACASFGVANLSEQITALLEDEFIGSALDVVDAIGGVLIEADVDSTALAEAIFAVLQGARGRKRPKVPKRDASGRAQESLNQVFWKREYKTERERFDLPYEYCIDGHKLVLQQTPFGPEGFASTVSEGLAAAACSPFIVT